jgi:hypothetical protein
MASSKRPDRPTRTPTRVPADDRADPSRWLHALLGGLRLELLQSGPFVRADVAARLLLFLMLADPLGRWGEVAILSPTEFFTDLGSE